MDVGKHSALSGSPVRPGARTKGLKMALQTVCFGLLVMVLTLLWIWTRRIYNFWSDCGVHTPPFSFLWGHLRTPFFQGSSIGDKTKLIYNYFKSRNLKHGGFYIFFNPWYVTTDLDIYKSILQTDFHHFADRGGQVVEGDPLTAHLLNLKGHEWKMRRSKLTPAFSSRKMKMIFETLEYCTHSLKKVMDDLEGVEVDIKDILGRLTTDMIGSCAFGIECNSLENPENEFRRKGKAVFERPKGFWRLTYDQFFISFPMLMKILNLKYEDREITNFFVGIVREIIDYREKNGVVRKDLMDLLIKLKNKKNLDDENESHQDVCEGMSVDEIAGEAFLSFEAGFESTSTVMTFCLFELAKHVDIQKKLREEINVVLGKYEGKITYDAMMEMPYLDMVLQESLRMYPPFTASRRLCTKRYKVPGTNITLEKGANVIIPIYGIHHDPLYYPEPEKFDPERFSEWNKKSRHPFAYLPFGGGPRKCIGGRFALIQAKVGIVSLLRDYEFEVGEKTQTPIKLSKKHFVLSAEGEIWLKHRRIH